MSCWLYTSAPGCARPTLDPTLAVDVRGIHCDALRLRWRGPDGSWSDVLFDGRALQLYVDGSRAAFAADLTPPLPHMWQQQTCCSLKQTLLTMRDPATNGQHKGMLERPKKSTQNKAAAAKPGGAGHCKAKKSSAKRYASKLGKALCQHHIGMYISSMCRG